MTIDGSIAILLVLGIVSVALLIKILCGLDRDLQQEREILEEIRQRNRKWLEYNSRTLEEIMADNERLIAEARDINERLAGRY